MFSADKTMLLIEMLFRTYYNFRQCDSTLNGVIKVFNLFNICDPKLDNAIQKLEDYKDVLLPCYNTFEKDIKLLVPPIYLGWGKLGFSKMFKSEAQMFFKRAYQLNQGIKANYLREDFNDNYFYHPRYLLLLGKNTRSSKYLLNAFCQNTPTPDDIHSAIPNAAISKEIIFSKVTEIIRDHLGIKKTVEEPYKTLRFELDDNLQITITKQETGYIGIRHIIYKKCYSLSSDYPNVEKYRAILQAHKFNINLDVWLGVKQFKDYGSDDDEIIKGIVDDLHDIKESIKQIKR